MPSGRFWAVIVILNLFSMATAYAFKPDAVFGTAWIRPLIAVVLFIEISRLVWRGCAQSERAGA